MSNLFEKIGSVVVSVGLAIGGFFGYVPEQSYVEVPVEEESLGADTVLPIAGMTFYLSGTGISSSATSFTLTSLTVTQNGKKITDSELSDIFYITLEPGSRTRQEIISCTTVVQNADGTATISGCTRGLAPITPYTASTTLQFAHAGGSIAIFSNPPQLYNQVAVKDNDETITGQWTFSTFPITPSSSPATATTSGVVELATGGEAASSTLIGDIGRLALGTNISTSSAPATGNVVVVTGDDGNIDAGFLPDTTGSTTVRYITASSTWTVPTSPFFKKAVVELVGGGGSGGGHTTNAGTNAGLSSGGGAGGGYCKIELSRAELTGTTTVFVEIGKGGALVGTVVGLTGSTTYFSTFASSTGGAGGASIDGGGGLKSNGGVGNSCDFAIAGQDGEAPNDASNGAGRGGNSMYGFGGAGGVDTGGTSGSGYGAGGGGAGTKVGSTSDGQGGAGTNGVVIITEYF